MRLTIGGIPFALASIVSVSLSIPPAAADVATAFDGVIQGHAQTMVEEGRTTFRYDTFGDEEFWGGSLRLHEALAGEKLGGVGPGVSPTTALGVGLKVDANALPNVVIQSFLAGDLDLNDPAVTLALLQLNAVVGVTGFFDGKGRLESIGIQCALCHSTVDDALAPGIGGRLDGWANRDLNVGAIIALAPNLEPLADALDVDVATVLTVLQSWGPGKFDAALILDGKAFQPDGRSAATLIPPAFGLAGINLHTWTGWGSVAHWNGFVATLEMHGKGTFFDPRLDDAEQFPLAAKHGYGHITNEDDRITAKLPALHFYQLAIPAPAPPPGSFDEAAAMRGDALFGGKARCTQCHTDALYTEPGWNLHRGAEIGIDDFQADRSPDRRYRTAPLKGLWTHTDGGFYHDGRFATLLDVVTHYDDFMALGLTESEKTDVVEYLMSLGDDVAPVPVALELGAAGAETSVSGATPSEWTLRVGPSPSTQGRRVVIELVSPQGMSIPPDLALEVYDVRGRSVIVLGGDQLAMQEGTVRLDWNAADRAGNPLAAGVYFLRVLAPSVGYHAERKVVLR